MWSKEIWQFYCKSNQIKRFNIINFNNKTSFKNKNFNKCTNLTIIQKLIIQRLSIIIILKINSPNQNTKFSIKKKITICFQPHTTQHSSPSSEDSHHSKTSSSTSSSHNMKIKFNRMNWSYWTSRNKLGVTLPNYLWIKKPVHKSLNKDSTTSHWCLLKLLTDSSTLLMKSMMRRTFLNQQWTSLACNTKTVLIVAQFLKK